MLHHSSYRAAFWLWTFLAVAAGLLHSAPARGKADDPTARDKARAIVIEGAKLYAKGDFAAALAHFQSAYAVFPSPKIHYNLGLAYVGLARAGQALGAFERFLREARDALPGQLADAREHVKRLSGKVAFVTVSGSPEGAEALLDGVLIGTTPLPGRIPVDVGQHAIVVRGAKFGSWTKSFTATAGQSIDLKMDPGSAARTAHSRSESEALVLKGVELRKQRKHLEAYEYFRRAFEISPEARPTAQLGLVEYQLGRWVDAEMHLERASKAADPFIDQNRATIQQALETVRSHIAYLEIKGTPPGAEVTVNGRKIGKLPLLGLVKTGAGHAEVVVRAPGHVTAHRTVAVQAQLTEQLFVTLQTLGTVTSTGVPPTSPEQPFSPPQAFASGPGDSIGDIRGRGDSRARAAGFVVGLMGVAAVGYGAYQSYRVHALTEEVPSTDSRGIQRGRAAERQQWWGYGLGAAALGGGSLLYWLGLPDGADSAGTLSLAIRPSRRSLMVSVQLR